MYLNKLGVETEIRRAAAKPKRVEPGAARLDAGEKAAETATNPYGAREAARAARVAEEAKRSRAQLRRLFPRLEREGKLNVISDDEHYDEDGVRDTHKVEAVELGQLALELEDEAGEEDEKDQRKEEGEGDLEA